MKFPDVNYLLYKNPVSINDNIDGSVYATFSVAFYDEDTVVNFSTYSIYPLSFIEENEDILIWDVFNTNNLYASSQKISSLYKANSLISVLYANYIHEPSSLTDHFHDHGTEITILIPGLSPFEEDHKITFTRYKTANHDGWTFNLYHMFILNDLNLFDKIKNNTDPLIYKPLEKIPFPNSIEAGDLIKSLKALESFKKDFDNILNKKTNLEKLNKSFSKKVYLTQYLENQSKDQQYNIKESNMSAFSMCRHITVNTELVKITSKEHAFANVPQNVSICTNPNLKKDDKIVYCGFGVGPNQCACALYTPSYKVLKTYKTQGSNSLSFCLSESIDFNGNKIYNLVNSDNDQVTYTLCPPVDSTLDQIISEADSIVKETLNSWPEDVSSTLEEQVSSIQPKPVKEKKSFILSLVS